MKIIVGILLSILFGCFAIMSFIIAECEKHTRYEQGDEIETLD